MRLNPLAAGVSCVVGLALWIGLVVGLPDDATTAPGFWWSMLAAAVVLGMAFGRYAVAEVAMGLGVPPLLLSPWTAPRGDGDGLWVLWLPLLLVFILVLAIAAGLGGAARGRLHGSA